MSQGSEGVAVAVADQAGATVRSLDFVLNTVAVPWEGCGSESAEAQPRSQDIVGWALNPGLSSSRAPMLVHHKVWSTW